MIQPDLTIEYPFIKLPFDYSLQAFKNSKKNVEKQMSNVLNEITLTKNKEVINQQEAIDELSEIIQKLKNIKQNINEDHTNFASMNQICEKRLQYLNKLNLSNETDQLNYHQTKLNCLLIDYLSREGYVSTAKKIIEEYNLQNFCQHEMQILIESDKIIKDLKAESCELALQWLKY